MATIFSHSAVGLTLATVAPVAKDKCFYVLMGVLPIVADADYLGFVLRVPYNSLWGHRGITHSILFSILFAAAAILLFELKKHWRDKLVRFACYFVAAISHPLLDALTNGGLGVAFFSPYNQLRYFFSYRPIEVSPMGMGFFSERGLAVLASEAFWILLPCLVVLLIHRVATYEYKRCRSH